MVVTTQELRHSTRNVVRLTGEYLGTEGTFYRAIVTWPHNINCFESQYDKAFAGHDLFRADIVDRIHMRVHVLMHSCNTMSLEDVEIVTLEEFGEIQRQVARVECITTTPTWVDLTTQKNYGMRKSESGGGSGGDDLGQHRKRHEDRNPDVDTCLRAMERFR